MSAISDPEATSGTTLNRMSPLIQCLGLDEEKNGYAAKDQLLNAL